MADPKYAHLPGIAYDQPDCYETDDLPESDQYHDFVEAEEDNVAVERFHLNPEAAAQKFRGKILDGSRVDFSDRISRSRRLGYDARTLWELAPTGEPETTLQKFLRLKCEVQELINDIQTKGLEGAENDDPNLRTQDILKEASLMQQQLLDLRLDKQETPGEQSALKKKLTAKIDEMKTSQDKRKPKGPQSGVSEDLIQYELCLQPETSKSNQLSRVTELENRLQRLETVLGSEKKDKLASVSFNPKNQSVLGCLTVLNSRLSLLEPSHIELIENRLSSVLQKVIKISEKKLDVQELERTLKLSDLYDLMEESSGTIQALPELAARLNSLNDLHEGATEIIKELASVKSLQEAIAAGTVENDKTLKELQAVLNETLKNSGVKT